MYAVLEPVIKEELAAVAKALNAAISAAKEGRPLYLMAGLDPPARKLLP
jgi:hypothetical protein